MRDKSLVRSHVAPSLVHMLLMGLKTENHQIIGLLNLFPVHAYLSFLNDQGLEHMDTASYNRTA